MGLMGSVVLVLGVLDMLLDTAGVSIDDEVAGCARAAWEEVVGLLKPGINADTYGEAAEVYNSLQLYAWVRYREMLGDVGVMLG